MAPTSQRAWPFRNELLSTKPGANHLATVLATRRHMLGSQSVTTKLTLNYESNDGCTKLLVERPRHLF
jgi:hypothetical protein